jgi:Asp-tRNA(Asn)/Glu-tRNA(Gln) amidotransferase A subunit family amidase
MNLNRLGAKEAAQLIERGELTAEKFLHACLERIEERERDVQAWAWLDAALATANAKKAKGPLFGVPIAVKDVFDTHDMPTEYGSRIYPGHRPRTDAAAVAVARRAGGTILGKTVTCEFATMVPSKTRNPHDLSRTPGGSSSGSAAAVADFMVPLAFGTQTAGSTVRPGSYCGIVAYKPTYNLLARSGLKASADSLDTVGLFARSVRDVAFFARALTGIAAFENEIQKPRIAMCRTPQWELVQPEMAALFEHAAKTLGAAEITLPEEFKALRDAHALIIRFEGARSFADEYTRFPDLMDTALRERVREGFAIDPMKYIAAQQIAAECRPMLKKVLEGYDVLLAPSATGEAPVGLAATGDTSMNVIWTLLHTPCVNMPLGKGPNGMPLGLQAVGRVGDDARTLACAEWIQARLNNQN